MLLCRGDLDSVNTSRVVQLLMETNQKQRTTLVMVTHDVSLRCLAHRVVHMRDGKIGRIETISETQRKRTYHAFLSTRNQKRTGMGFSVERKTPDQYETYSESAYLIGKEFRRTQSNIPK
jgi:ABC-type methionine transport system ATPase subunit